MIKSLPSWILALLLILALPIESVPQTKRGGTMSVAIRNDLVLMNPLVATGSSEQTIRELMFEPLLGLDLNGNLQPHLVESWRVSDDGRLYTLRLRRGIKFHNGVGMTAEDVKFSIDYTMNPKNGARGITALGIVERVESATEDTLKVYLRKPSPGFLYSLTEIRTLSIVPKGSLPEGFSKLEKYPAGTGPFKFFEWKPQQRIVFEGFNEYWGHKALVDKLVLRPIKDADMRMTALRAGDVDLIERVPYEWVKQIVDQKIKGFSFTSAPYAAGRTLDFNVANPPFDNKKLRRAVAHAIDRQEILHAAYYGFGEASDQKFPIGHAWYVEKVPSPSYDLTKAKALLKEAGYKGEMIEILTYQGEDRQFESITLQAQLKRIGMNTKLKVLERGAAVALQRKGEFALKFGGGSVKPYFLMSYLTDFQCEPDRNRRNNNDSGYCDKEMDSLLAKAEAELSRERSRILLNRIVAKMHEDLPELFVGFVPEFFAFGDYVRGFTTDSFGSLRWSGGGLHFVWLDK